jgi:hypothetical protein
MSMCGNNAHWLSARVISHQGFNSGYDRVYFQPDGTILRCYAWHDELMEPTERIKEVVEEIRNACICGTKFNLKLEEVDNYSPYLVVGAFIDDNLPLLQRAYFSEHTTDSKGRNDLAVKDFPDRPEDAMFVNNLFPKLIMCSV